MEFLELLDVLEIFDCFGFVWKFWILLFLFGNFWIFTVFHKKSAVAISRDPVSSLPGAQDNKTKTHKHNKKYTYFLDPLPVDSILAFFREVPFAVTPPPLVVRALVPVR